MPSKSDDQPAAGHSGRSGSAEPPLRYEIRVRGALDARWSSWFEGMHVVSNESGDTTISGPVADQAALHGLLIKIRDLGLHLISVGLVGPDG